MEQEIVCRVCMQLVEPMVSIYEEVEEMQATLCTLLEECGGIVCKEDDLYSQYLCKDCTGELLITAKFREKCDLSKDVWAESGRLIKTHTAEEESNQIEYASEDFGEPEEFTDERLTENAPPAEQPFTAREEEEDSESMDQYVENANEEFISHSVISQPTVRLPKTKFNCDECGALFAYSTNLVRHIQKVHNPAIMYMCEKCDHAFTSALKLQAHAEQCNAIQSTAKQHHQQKAKTSNTSLFECTECGKRMKSQCSIEAHMRTHSGERPFVCEICQKAFNTQSYLKTHRQRHFGQPKYVCPTCGKYFYETSNLKAHMRIHTGDKPHECSVCQRRFGRVMLLEHHMRTHTAEKPKHKCRVCGMICLSRTQMSRHMQHDHSSVK